MDWITDTQIEEIRSRAASQTFHTKKTDTYYWYARFLWYVLTVLWLIATIITHGHDRRTIEGLVLSSLVSMYYAVQWKRHREKYVLHLELRQNHRAN